jgi:hypothetical protein
VRRTWSPGAPIQCVGLERDLELEKRKGKDMHDQLRDKDKEYTKLKVRRFDLTLHLLTSSQNQYDKIKRKALLTPGALGPNGVEGNPIIGLTDDLPATTARHSIPAGLAGLGVSMGQVVEGMEANRVRPSSSCWPQTEAFATGPAHSTPHSRHRLRSTLSSAHKLANHGSAALQTGPVPTSRSEWKFLQESDRPPGRYRVRQCT